MRLAVTTLTALGLLLGAAAVQAAEESGASEDSPAIQKNEQGAVPDASGSSAGHQEEQDEGSASSGAKGSSAE
jgi:hypothetical protein